MDLDKITLFSAMKRRLGWLTQRQEILAQNIANADTPEQRSRDLKPFDFRALVKQGSMQVDMRTTRPDHLPGRPRTLADSAEDRQQKPYETSPAGNAVVLEEQMMKMNETTNDHRLMTELYRKQVALFKTAIGKGQ